MGGSMHTLLDNCTNIRAHIRAHFLVQESRAASAAETFRRLTQRLAGAAATRRVPRMQMSTSVPNVVKLQQADLSQRMTEGEQGCYSKS